MDNLQYLHQQMRHFLNLFDELEISADVLLNNQDLVILVLIYHVTKGRLYAKDVLEKQKINTLLKGKDGFLYQDSGV